MMMREDDTQYNWLIYNKLEGTFVEFKGTTRKAQDLYDHLDNSTMGKTDLYRDFVLIK